MTLSLSSLSKVPDQNRDPQKTGGGFQRTRGRIANVAFAASGLLGLAGCNPISSQDIAQNWKDLGYEQKCDNIFTKPQSNGNFIVVVQKDGLHNIHSDVTNSSFGDEGGVILFKNKGYMYVPCKGDPAETKDRVASIVVSIN